MIPFIIEVAICDFGMSGHIDKLFSLPNYASNKYRDNTNIKDFPESCDIYSLGEFLHMLIILYYFYEIKDLALIETMYSKLFIEEF